MNDLTPEESPFAGDAFARAWEGWRGRTARRLEVQGLTASYVRRTWGPLCTRAALPFGLPIFRDDFTAERAAWVRAFFGLGRSLKASLSLYSAPRHTYPDVQWTSHERRVVVLDSEWEAHLEPAVLRRSRRAAEAGWEVRALGAADLRGADRAVRETDARHGEEARFSADFCARILDLAPEGVSVRALGAVRDGLVGAFQMIFAHRDYEVGWMLCSTEDARRDNAGPFLLLRWLTASREGGIRAVDLGASPTPGVAAFKSSFGAVPAPVFTGIRGPHLFGD